MLWGSECIHVRASGRVRISRACYVLEEVCSTRVVPCRSELAGRVSVPPGCTVFDVHDGVMFFMKAFFGLFAYLVWPGLAVVNQTTMTPHFPRSLLTGAPVACHQATGIYIFYSCPFFIRFFR